jgi:glycosyltransferase involved in cell wall biosynthesis
MKKYIVQLLSRRRNYDVAEILYKENMLDRLVTDFYCYKGKIKYESILKVMLSEHELKVLMHYYNAEIPDKAIVSDWFTGVYFRTLLRISSMNYKGYILASKRLASITKKQMNLSNSNALYGYDITSVEIFRTAEKRGFHLVLEQCVAPRNTQIKMYELFKEKYGINVNKEIENCSHLRDRELMEWDMANIILVPSSYVKKEIMSAGANASQIRLVPYGFNLPLNNQNMLNEIIDKRLDNKSPFTVLFVGNSTLRKGVQDIAHIASKLISDNIEFRIVGSMNTSMINQFNINKIKNIKLLGNLDRKSLYKEYQSADLFILPSYLEGSAMVILEALSFGLPVITTEESGSPIISDINGYVCRAGDIEYMINHIIMLKNHIGIRHDISKATIPLLQKINFDTYRANLIKELL